MPPAKAASSASNTMVEGGADLDLADPEGVTPLLMAIAERHFETAALPDQSRRERRQVGLVGTQSAVLRRRPEHPSARRQAGPAVAGRNDEPADHRTAPRRRSQPEPPAEAPAALPQHRRGSRSGRHAHHRHHAAACGPPRPSMRRRSSSCSSTAPIPNLPNIRGITPVMAAAGLGSVDADTRGVFTTEDVQQRSIAR